MSTILIIDNCDDISEILDFVLTKKGHACAVVKHKDFGYDFVVHNRPDIVIMGIHTPGMDSKTFVDKIRISHPKTSFILISGTQNLDKHAQEMGITCLVKQPFAVNTIVRLVQFFAIVPDVSTDNKHYN